MARYRTYTIEFKRRVAEEHLSGGVGLSELARRHDISRELLRIWVRKYEAGEFASGGGLRGGTPASERKNGTARGEGGRVSMEQGVRQKGRTHGAPARGEGIVIVGAR